MLRVVVASRSNELWHMEASEEATWKTVMEGYATAMSLSGQGLHVWVGDQKVSAGTLVRAGPAGSLVIVSAETDQQAHMIALGDRLRNYCCAHYGGCVSLCFENESGSAQMSQGTFLR